MFAFSRLRNCATAILQQQERRWQRSVFPRHAERIWYARQWTLSESKNPHVVQVAYIVGPVHENSVHARRHKPRMRFISLQRQRPKRTE